MSEVVGPALTARFEHALLYALHAHGGQIRKKTEVPYASHLLAVAALVLDDGGDEDETIGALLHDAGEDAGGEGRLVDIRARFGDRVARIVDGCTDSYETPKPEWRPRKERYIERLPDEPPEVIRVSLADKLANARSALLEYGRVGDELWGRFNAGRDQQLWYFRTLAKTFRGLSPSPMVDELDRVVDELERRSGGSA
jgi:(p)ppGpp synthase/HD superfamily hydrolase